ncbi:hypothetical protein Misp01_05380 [Microtetraspora sp. NBRC 13810]|uniref:hypothetical protein n=1 Tax=Microtetraspora sp. NBRC 13810 TaxID=3030990 RepID=UPI0024A2D4ED|nr:hypothetical protein [Microtetraspora sp. NBRC 13810]GLW05408.1 hypothetical protein Misp01_05380 [Microtetraspora sp. NBRC 13810]
MNGELPESLRWAHSLIADVAPLGNDDDRDRLQGVSSHLDIAEAARNSRTGTNASAAHVRAAGNDSDDMAAFEDSLPVAQVAADKGGVAAMASGTATMLLVTYKVVWRLYVIIALISLVIALARYFAFGPAAGSVASRKHIALLRERMRSALAGIKANIRRNPVAALRHARALLGSTAAMGNAGRWTAVAAAATLPPALVAIATGPWENNEEARDLTERALSETSEGRAALAYARDHNITTIYRNGLRPGAYESKYYRNTNVLILGAEDYGNPDQLAGEFIRHIEVAKKGEGHFGGGPGYGGRTAEQDEAWYRLHYDRIHDPLYYQGRHGADLTNWPYRQINQLFDLD